MLIFSRRKSESFYIGNKITVTIMEIRGGQVKLGIKAPKNIEVHREEIFQRINKNKGY